MSSSIFGALARRISAIDMDELFSYQTKKEVRMLDRRLGYLCWTVRLLVWGYIIGFVFVANEGYTQQEVSHGHVITQVEGATFSMGRAGARSWDAVDASRPSLESGALFLATQVLHTQHQEMSNCTSPAKKCSIDADCESRPPLSTGRCSAGMCWEMQWCPAQSETQSDTTEIHTLEGADSFTVWFKASIQFTSLDSHRIFSTMSQHEPVRYVPPTSRAATAAAVRVALALQLQQVEARGAAGAAADKALTLAELTRATTLPAIDPAPGSSSAAPPAPPGASLATEPNQFAVRDLLELAGTTYDMVKQTGCVLSVSLEHNCYVDDPNDCVPKVHRHAVRGAVLAVGGSPDRI